MPTIALIHLPKKINIRKFDLFEKQMSFVNHLFFMNSIKYVPLAPVTMIER